MKTLIITALMLSSVGAFAKCEVSDLQLLQQKQQTFQQLRQKAQQDEQVLNQKMQQCLLSLDSSNTSGVEVICEVEKHITQKQNTENKVAFYNEQIKYIRMIQDMCRNN